MRIVLLGDAGRVVERLAERLGLPPVGSFTGARVNPEGFVLADPDWSAADARHLDEVLHDEAAQVDVAVWMEDDDRSVHRDVVDAYRGRIVEIARSSQRDDLYEVLAGIHESLVAH